MISFNILEKVINAHDDVNMDFWERIIISHNGKFYKAWYIFYVLCCFSSSYIYGYLAMFGHDGNRDNTLETTTYVYEAIFIIAIGIEFITDFPKKGTGTNGVNVRDLSIIATKYFKGNFAFDVFPLIPFERIPWDHSRVFYLTKVVRIILGFKILNVGSMMESIKAINKKKLDKIIEEDPIAAEDNIKDQT